MGANYGGILQAWALKTILERDSNVTFLLRGHKLTSATEDLREFVFRLYNRYIRRNKDIEVFHPVRETILKNTRPFIRRHFRYMDIDRQCCDRLDAIIVGSDQVWRNIYAGVYLEDNFLGFAEGSNVRKIAYAASFGVDYREFTESEVSMASRLLPQFDAVSVRESSGIELCEKMLGYEGAVRMPDPTLLLDKEDYLPLIEGIERPEHFTPLFRYVLDQSPDSALLVDCIEKELGAESFTVHSKIDDWHAPIAERIHPPLEHWLLAVATSEFVVTDSFHGCVFSIIFNKDFIVVGNRHRGMARIESLLEQFGLWHRYIDTSAAKDISIRDLSPVDWDNVNRKRKELQKQGIDFLRSNLN